MSNYSSDDELGDSLQIKPPQVRASGRADRPHRRDRRENFAESSYHGNRHSGFYRKEYEDTGYEGPRRKDYGHSSLRRGDDDFGNRPQRHHYDHGLERTSHRIRVPHERHDPVEKRYKETSRDRQERVQPTSRYRSESPPVRDDSRQLQKHKKKRKHAEQEEERAFREIEKKRERERRREEGRIDNEGSGSSGSRKRTKIDRRNVRSPARPQSRDSDLQQSDTEEILDLTVSDDDVRNLLPRINGSERESHSDEGQQSNASDDKEHTNRTKADLRHNEDRTSNAASDISSDSEEKASGSETSKSKGESASEDSESDSSGDSTHSTNSKEAKHKKDAANGKLGQKNQKQKVGSKSDSEISDDGIEEVPSDEREESIPLEKDSILETGSVSEVKPEVVERELTEVEKACQELDLLEPYYPSIQGCRRVEEFQLMNRIEEGTYGVVYRAKDKRTNEVVALKRLKMEKEKDGFPITSLREINTLLKAQHENIVTVREIVVGSNTDKIFLVMDYVEHDLKALMETLKQKKQEFIMGEIKCLLIQLLRAVAHLHDNWILHRDLKTSNLLLSHKGILKVGDFGLAREYGSPLKAYTPIVVTLWYRAPELLLGAKEYSTPIDVWSVGCIFGELLKMEPMFPGKSEANQLNLIFQTLGTPNDRIWHGYSKMPLLQKMTFGEYPVNKLKTKFGILSDSGIDLMNKFLTYNPEKRITAEEALGHGFFREAPLPIDPSIFPTWPAKSEMGVRKHASPKPPSGGRQFKDLKEDDSVGFFLGAGDRRPPVGAGFSLKF